MQRLRCRGLTCSSRGNGSATGIDRKLAARGKGAAARHVHQARDHAGNGGELFAGLFHPRRIAKARHGGEKAHRVGVPGIAENLADRPFFDDPAGIHYRDAMGDFGDHAEIVGDKEHGHAALALQFEEQVENLRLDRHVKRRCWLIGDQQRRIAGERHGDRRALPHAARQFVRILAGAALGIRYADAFKQCDGCIHRRLAVATAMDADRLGNLVSDGEDGIEARHRLLEYHADVVAPDPAHALVV